MSIGVAIHKERTRQRMSQAMLARRAGLSRTSISNIEADRQNISMQTLREIADALETTPERLMTASIAAPTPTERTIRDLIDRGETLYRSIGSTWRAIGRVVETLSDGRMIYHVTESEACRLGGKTLVLTLDYAEAVAVFCAPVVSPDNRYLESGDAVSPVATEPEGG